MGLPNGVKYSKKAIMAIQLNAKVGFLIAMSKIIM